MKITQLDFLNRFTVEETGTILVASDSVPAVRVYLFKLEQASEVDLRDPNTVAGIQALEAAQLIGPGRADEILASKLARVLAPFDGVWPGEYNVMGFDGTTYSLEEAGDFAAEYVEVI